VGHRDPYAGSVRLHLGLITPNDDRCRIYIDGKPYSWRDGEAIVFDETYIHKAFNETDKQRIILFCDVERPMRNAVAQTVNRFMFNHFMRHTSSGNQAADPLGLFNKAFKHIYKVRLVGKALKRRNRFVYYTVKYALFGGLLALFLI
jgi:beta-hydroxylase